MSFDISAISDFAFAHLLPRKIASKASTEDMNCSNTFVSIYMILEMIFSIFKFFFLLGVRNKNKF